MAQIDKPSLHFNTKLYTGTGSSNAITGVGFQPDFTWIKSRNNGTNNNHMLFDAVRGATKYVKSDQTSAENTLAETLKSFDSDGFTVGTQGDVNTNNINFASWNWKAGNSAGSSNTDGNITSTVSANTTAGISVVTWTGTGNAQTVGHGLGSAPNMIMLKERSSTSQWQVSNDALGWTKRLNLDDTSITDTTSYIWNDTAPTNQVFSIGTSGAVSENGQTYVAYCFAEKKGFSKFGIYKGRGSQSANNKYTFTYCGFAPAFLMVQNTQQGSDNWFIWDNKRPGYNQIQKYLSPNSANAEADSSSYAIDFLSNGFRLRSATGAINNNTEDIIYMAFAENPIVGSNNVAVVAR